MSKHERQFGGGFALGFATMALMSGVVVAGCWFAQHVMGWIR